MEDDKKTVADKSLENATPEEIEQMAIESELWKSGDIDKV